jgi:hypothetical protein
VNRYLTIGIIATIFGESLFSQAWTQQPSCTPPTQPEATKLVNSSQQSNVIVIGKVSSRPYVVVVPGNSDKLLNTVRRYVADAFLTQHKLGAYVYAGGFAKREEAECLSILLRSHGLDARVVYLR